MWRSCGITIFSENHPAVQPFLSTVTMSANPHQISLEISHEEAGDEGVGCIKLRRGTRRAEFAKIHFDLGAHTQQVMYHIFRYGSLYEKETAMLAIGALRTGDIALDIGAHVGYFSLLFRLLVGSTGAVYAFEPMPATYRRLVMNILRNGFTNVMPLPLAIADKPGSAEFHIDPENEGESTLLSVAHGETCHVMVSSLDDLFAESRGKRPRLLKIDAEGVETLILRGGARFFSTHAPDMVICEINRTMLAAAGTSEWDIRSFFRGRNYRCAVINMEGSDMGLSDCGARFYRYVEDSEPVAPNAKCVFNVMFTRDGSELYPDTFM